MQCLYYLSNIPFVIHIEEFKEAFLTPFVENDEIPKSALRNDVGTSYIQNIDGKAVIWEKGINIFK